MVSGERRYQSVFSLYIQKRNGWSNLLRSLCLPLSCISSPFTVFYFLYMRQHLTIMVGCPAWPWTYSKAKAGLGISRHLLSTSETTGFTSLSHQVYLVQFLSSRGTSWPFSTKATRISILTSSAQGGSFCKGVHSTTQWTSTIHCLSCQLCLN